MKFFHALAVLACGIHGPGAARTGDAAKETLQVDDSGDEGLQDWGDASISECSSFKSVTDKAYQDYLSLLKVEKEAEETYKDKKNDEAKCTTCISTIGYDYNLQKSPPACELECSQSYVICPGESLKSGENATSSNGDVALIMQGDGNLVLYNGIPANKKKKWESKTDYTSSNMKLWQGGVFTFQKNYETAIYPSEFADDVNATINPKFLSKVGYHVGGCWNKDGSVGTGGKEIKDIQLKFPTSKTDKDCDDSCRIIVQDDCNLVMYKGSKEVIWDIGSRCTVSVK